MDGEGAGPYGGAPGGWTVAGSARRASSAGLPAAGPTRSAPCLELPAEVLVDAVAALAAARTELGVAGACLPLLLGRAGVRGVAVVQRRRRSAVVLRSAGYDCDTMGAGTVLPLEAGLPVTQAVRSGRTVVQGAGPSWVALPLGGDLQPPGALLLSLTCAPPEPAGLLRLERLSRTLGDALHRARGQDRDVGALTALSARLRPRPVIGEGEPVELVVRSAPVSGVVGGDVLACLPRTGGGTWLLAADVCGSGLQAAQVAAVVRTALRACAPTAGGPAALLAQLDAAVRPEVGPGSFVTAVAVLVSPDGRCAHVASAGHPPPLVLHHGRATSVALEPGPPLALEGQLLPAVAGSCVELPEGGALMLHTDGLTDRRTDDGVVLLDPRRLAAGVPDDLEQAADAVLVAAASAGAVQDDVSLLLARPQQHS